MNAINNLLKTTLLIVLLSFTFEGKAQCSQDAWVACFPSCTYVEGDTVSYSSHDWVVKANTTYTYLAPSTSGAAAFSWQQITNIPAGCVTSTTPIVAPTDVRGTYCTTTFGIGLITRDGGTAITARGHVFGTSPNPTLTDGVLLDAGVGTTDEFEGLIPDLTPETKYYVRTYATNSAGTRYGTQDSLTTKATADCADCILGCDETDPGLLNPSVTDLNTTYSIIGIDDTLCLTEDRSYAGSTVRGMLKLCNGAQITISGSVKVDTKELGAGFNGQIVYEGCNEKILGSGSYSGEKYAGSLGIPNQDEDPKQMISYCSSCDENDKTQFFEPTVATYLWAATCRPTSTVLTALPVELTSFTGYLTKNGVELNWETGAEINNSHFNVQISYDGVNWETIGVVQGADNSTESLSYSFLNNQIGVGVEYYRLEQVDFDGTNSFSNAIHISFSEEDKPKGFIAFQNVDRQVEVQAKFNGMGEAYLIDTRGRIIETKTFISTNKSGTQFEFDTVDLSEGVYFVKIKSGNALIGEKVQIIK